MREHEDDGNRARPFRLARARPRSLDRVLPRPARAADRVSGGVPRRNASVHIGADRPAADRSGARPQLRPGSGPAQQRLHASMRARRRHTRARCAAACARERRRSDRGRADGATWRHRLRPIDLRSRPGRLHRRAQGGHIGMTEQRPRVKVYRGTVPLWLVLLLVAPLGMVFLTSLILAVLVFGAAAALAAFVLPQIWKRPTEPETPNTIELDPSQYHRISS